MKRLLWVALLGALLGVLAFGAGTGTAAGPAITTTTHFTASYTDSTGASYVCWGTRTVSQPAVDPGSSSAPPATVLEKELCLADTTSAWYVHPAGTYTIRPGFYWISDCDGRWATSGTITIAQRVPGIQLWSIVAWY